MSAKPFPEDVLVNRFWARAAIAVSMNDPEAAMELLRDMVDVEGKIFLTICRPPGVVPRLSSDELAVKGPVFRGRPMLAKWSGRCQVCNVAIGVGSSILYNSELRRAAHDQCGEIDEC
jgi:hypothetical protein